MAEILQHFWQPYLKILIADMKAAELASK